jgi:tRNA nucleotidyltransferase (CCA-adding enzyme)
MLRAVRFEQRFGFAIEARTLELLREAITLIERVSGDRIRHELDHIIDEERFLLMSKRLDEIGLLTTIHPGLKWSHGIQNRMARLNEFDPSPLWHDFLELSGNSLRRQLAYILWIIHQPVGVIRAVINRLKFPSSQIDVILSAVSLWKEATKLKGKSPSEIVAILDEVHPPGIYANYLVNPDEEIVNLLEQYACRWRFVKPTIDGHYLREKGIPPGPIYKDILKSLRDAWLDGGITSPQQENTLLDFLLSRRLEEG